MKLELDNVAALIIGPYPVVPILGGLGVLRLWTSQRLIQYTRDSLVSGN